MQQQQEALSPEEAQRLRLLADVDGLQKHMDGLAQQVCCAVVHLSTLVPSACGW